MPWLVVLAQLGLYLTVLYLLWVLGRKALHLIRDCEGPQDRETESDAGEKEFDGQRFYGSNYFYFSGLSDAERLELALSRDYRKLESITMDDFRDLDGDPDRRKELFRDLLVKLKELKIIEHIDDGAVERLNFRDPTDLVKDGHLEGLEASLHIIRNNLFAYFRETGHGMVVGGYLDFETKYTELLEEMNELCDGELDDWDFELTETGEGEFNHIKARSGNTEIETKLTGPELVDTRFFAFINEILDEEGSDYMIFDRKQNDLEDYEVYCFTPAQITYVGKTLDTGEFFEAYRKEGSILRTGNIPVEKEETSQ